MSLSLLSVKLEDAYSRIPIKKICSPTLLTDYQEFVAAVVDLSLFFLFACLLGFNYLLVGAGAFTMAAIFNNLSSIRYVFVSGARFRWR